MFLFYEPLPIHLRRWFVTSFYIFGGLANGIYALISGDVAAQAAALVILTAAVFVSHLDYTEEWEKD